eukprot:4570132-Prymnesium_polylepis.1
MAGTPSRQRSRRRYRPSCRCCAFRHDRREDLQRRGARRDLARDDDRGGGQRGHLGCAAHRLLEDSLARAPALPRRALLQA